MRSSQCLPADLSPSLQHFRQAHRLCHGTESRRRAGSLPAPGTGLAESGWERALPRLGPVLGSVCHGCRRTGIVCLGELDAS